MLERFPLKLGAVLLSLTALVAIRSVAIEALYVNMGSVALLKSVMSSAPPEDGAHPETERAVLLFQQATEQGQLGVGYRKLGEAYLSLRQYELSADALQRYLLVQPRDRLAHLHLAQALDGAGDHDAAVEHWRIAEAGPLLKAQAATEVARGEYASAQKHLLTAIAINPDDGAAWFALASSYKDKGRREETSAAYANYMETTDDDPFRAHMAQAFLLRLRGSWDDAEAAYRSAYADAPTNPNSLKDLGMMLLYEEKDLAAAETVFREALLLEPGNVWTHINMGNICRLQGDFDAAEDWYRRASEADPSSSAPGEYLKLNAAQRAEHLR